HALPEGSKALQPNLLVGDEHEVDILNARLPNQTSAVTVLDNQLVEVENAANFAGQTIRIKIIDVDEDGALAEPLGVVATATEGKKKRRRRGRKAPMTADEQAQQLRELAEEAAKGSRPVPAIGISTEAEAEDEEAQDKTKVAAPVAIGVEPKPAEAAGLEPDGAHRKRRRRRRRGRGVHGDVAQFGIPQEGEAAQVEASEEIEVDADTAPAHPTAVPETAAESEIRRKRRRRRRRGRGDRPEGGAPQIHGAPPTAPVPDRHIFRVNPEGAAEPTGQTAPREPSRSIAPWNRRPAPPAIEAPPPSLRVPEEPARITKPARRRRTTAEAPIVGGELQASQQAALPSPPDDAKPKRTRKTAAASADGEKPKRKTSATKTTATAKKKSPSKTAVARKKKVK
ncbi:MAG: hypothetical protein GIW97_05470, partial [Candidatus Eremiobacteraeota bacterium]|nr:hypothetical protein [Candidatus Eremiobacteraeota bacterium]